MRIVKTAPVRRQELLDAAMRLFATKGYDQTSINEVIAAVGVSKGAFYHHFAAKEDLLEALAAGYAAAAAERARTVLDDPILDSFERLSRFLSRMRDNKAESAVALHTAFAPIFRPENLDLYMRTQEAVNAVVRPILARIIAEGVAEKTFDTPDTEAAAETILHLMGSTRVLVAELYAANGPAAVDAATRLLFLKLQYLGTVIDRILGIPEGSIELVDEQSIRVVTEVWRARISAA